MLLPGTPAHIVEMVRQYQAFEQTVRSLTLDLAPDHSSDLAKRLADDDANLVKADPETIKTAIANLQQNDPIFFEGGPLSEHLARLMIFARNHGLGCGGDPASLRSAATRMQAPDKRRCAYGFKKAFAAAGLPAPQPQADDTNVADAPPARAPERQHKSRDAERPSHFKLQPMKQRIVRT